MNDEIIKDKRYDTKSRENERFSTGKKNQTMDSTNYFIHRKSP